ncbi:unnamed protein product [Mycena citricolor]|uniref:Uncharacterized protein n=1 Tax=Mycena citricolor TaxID=2018698 RepID=A0AAD2GUT6_9AGAR|nr:unnamed protein product [Mycena citricolor]
MVKTPKKSGGKGKQPKTFLDHDATRGLAESIAGMKEQKSHSKVARLSQAVPSRRDPATPKPKSESKIKLKEAKAILAAKSSSLKKDRKKRRKELTGRAPAASQDSPNITAQPMKKRVSFA